MKPLLLSALFILATLGAAYAQENSGIKFNVGAGFSLLSNTFDQQATLSGASLELKDTTGSFGFNGFVDITQFITVNFGFRGAMGQLNRTATWGTLSGTSNYSNSVSQFELGGELKYPFQVNKTFSIAPKVGLDYVGFLGGSIGSTDVSSSTDGKQQFSPVYVTLGVDLNFDLDNQWFVRVPLDLGVGLNSKLSTAYYSGVTYSSSSSIGLRGGVEVGYSL